MPNYKFSDITGMRFGRLTAIERTEKYTLHGGWKWKCLCDCGKVTSVIGAQLRNGNTRSCGCLKKELVSQRMKGNSPANKKHGHSKAILVNGKRCPTVEYKTWNSMINRCKGSREHDFRNYTLRGICVCNRWLGENGFKNFLQDMGIRPEGMSIDRINVDGNYEPSNCRWADKRTQVSNIRKRFDVKSLIYTQEHGFEIDELRC